MVIKAAADAGKENPPKRPPLAVEANTRDCGWSAGTQAAGCSECVLSLCDVKSGFRAASAFTQARSNNSRIRTVKSAFSRKKAPKQFQAVPEPHSNLAAQHHRTVASPPYLNIFSPNYRPYSPSHSSLRC